MKKRILSICIVIATDVFLLFLGAFLLNLSPSPGLAQTVFTIRYVAPNQAQCGTNMPCYTHIQAAVDAAAEGDES